MYAIRRRSADEIARIAHLVNPKRRVERQGIACPTIIPVRRDDSDFGDFRERSRKGIDASRKVAVIVTDQDFHKDYCSNMSARSLY